MKLTYIVWSGKQGKRKKETLTPQEYFYKYRNSKPISVNT